MTNSQIIHKSDDRDVIIAQCTPQGSGAIALLRLSGDDAVLIANRFSRLSSGKSLSDVQSHTINHGYVIDLDECKEPIDEVLFFVMHGPRTFTGQNTVEISCHNNQFIIQKIIDLAIKLGARHAGRGEFSMRSFLNGKIDLLQAEAINEVIHAQNEFALQKSMSQLHGNLSSFVLTLKDGLVHLLSLVEASFEFLDEEQRDFDFDNQIKVLCENLLISIKKVQQNFAQQQQIRQGIKIVLVGSVNVGKSTIFNSLVRKNRAIVTDVAGTTRDSIETTVYRHGNFLMFVDTAGLRKTDDFIEQQGIERSWIEAGNADIILLIIDAPTKFIDQEYSKIIQEYQDKVIVVINKIDASISPVVQKFISVQTSKTVYTSAQNRVGIDELECAIEEKIQHIFSQFQSPYLLNQRQYQLLSFIHMRLDSVVNNLSDGVHYELLAYQLKEMLEKVGELTGRNATEVMLDNIFDSFCVGK